MSTAKKKDRLAPEPGQAYVVLRDLMDRATRAHIALESRGEQTTAEAIWQEMGGQGEPPRTLRDIITDAAYQKLLSIRRSLAVLPDVRNLALIREFAGQAAQLAITSALEDLVLHPDKVPTRDKVNFAKVLTELYNRLEGATDKKEPVLETALNEEKNMEEALERIPEALRPRMRELWLATRASELRKERALTMLELNKGLSYAREPVD